MIKIEEKFKKVKKEEQIARQEKAAKQEELPKQKKRQPRHKKIKKQQKWYSWNIYTYRCWPYSIKDDTNQGYS